MEKKKIDDGGPAFPVRNETERACAGMSLRDYFAAAAPEQVNNDATVLWVEGRTGLRYSGYQDLKAEHLFWYDAEAIMRYMHADAMLRARAQEAKP